MTPYGKFLADDESWNGSGDVFLARQRGHQGEPNVVVKIFPRIDAGTPEAKARAHNLRSAAIKLQSDASQNQDRFVAPILEDRLMPDGVHWQASRRYAGSADSFIQQLDGRPASADVLWHICFSVASGALALQQANRDSPAGSRRSHGNLKLTRILLAREDGRLDAEVVVTQPEPGDATFAKEYELRDLEYIGRLIFQLVVGRRVTAEAEWTEAAHSLASPTKAWKTLGSKHSAWLSLCRELLAVRENRAGLTLAAIEARLGALKPEPESRGKGLWIGLAVAIVAVLAGAIWWPRPIVERSDPWIVYSEPPGADIAYLDGPTNAPVEIGRALPSIQTNKPKRIVVARFLDPTNPYAKLDEQRLTNDVVAGRGITNRFQFPFGTVSLGSTNDFARVRVVYNPRDVRILHEDQVKANPSQARLNLSPGRYLAEFSASGSRSRSVPFTLTNGQALVIVTNLTTLAEGTLEVTLESSLPNAVFYEGVSRLAHFSAFSKKTAHTLTLRAPVPWGDLQTNLVLTADGIEGRTNTVFSVDPPRGEVRFDLPAEGGPAKADVWISQPQRAQAGGITASEASFQWPPGTFNVEIVAEGYRSTNFPVTVSAGTNVAYPVYLEPLYGTFTATANLEGAVLFTNGVLAGPIGKSLNVLLAPNRDHVLTAGFTNELGELDPVSTTANLKPAERTNTVFQFQFATVDLQPELTNTILTVAGRTAPLTSLRRFHRPSTPIDYSAIAEHYLPATNTVAGLTAGSSLAVPIRLQPRLYPVVTRVGPVDALLTNVVTRTAWVTGITNVRWGTYTLSLSHPDHPELGTDIQTLVTTTNGTAEQTYWLPHGRVDVTTGQPGLLVKLDGVELKGVTTPLRGRLMKPGVHELTFALRSFEGKSVVTKSITVNEIPRGTAGSPSQPFPFPDVRFLPTEYVTQGGLKLLLVEDFLVGETEVTRGQFNRVLGEPATGNEGLPATTTTTEQPAVSWANARRFCAELTRSERNNINQQLGTDWEFAIPTLEEWKVYFERRPPDAAPADGLKLSARPNPARSKYNLQDVFGNASEWIVKDGSAWVAGGSYNSDFWEPDPAQGDAAEGASDIGFRIVLRRSTR